jgi:homoserine dehydrogenase
MEGKRHWRLGFAGFGNVHRRLAALLVERRDELQARHGLTFETTMVASRRRGAWVEPRGLDLAAALRDGWSSTTPTLEAIGQAPIDLLFEGTPLDPRRGEPATSHARAALRRGVSVVSANKGPVAFAARELYGLALASGAGFRFESAVADCMPVFDLVEVAVPVGRVVRAEGVLNSTSNHVLQEMARGGDRDAAVAEMVQRGFAEADPSYDLDGWDQAVKIVAIAAVLLGRDARPADVARTPLDAVDLDWLRAETRAGRTVRLAARAGPEGPPRVDPLSFAPGSFLASLGGWSLGLSLETELAGTLNIGSVDPGVEQTAYGMLTDLVAIHQGRLLVPSPLLETAQNDGSR